MTTRSKAAQAKIANIVDMAPTRTAMIRIFERGSKAKIEAEFVRFVARFGDIGNSSLPDARSAAKVLPFLHGAIDTPILQDLHSRYPDEVFCGQY